MTCDIAAMCDNLGYAVVHRGKALTQVEDFLLPEFAQYALTPFS